MTAPRQILPNATYLITRRCSERRMFLRPSTAVNETLRYVLAVAVERFGVQLHAYCFLSNHCHLVLSDPLCALPAFEQCLSSLIARSCNVLLHHREALWAPGSYNAVTLVEQGDVLDKLGYTLANPVSAGLVRHASEWPGLWSSPEDVGAPPITVQRPKHFFRTGGSMPESASLGLTPPPGIESLQDFRRALRGELERREAAAAQSLAEEGRTFLGADGALRQDPFATPAREEPQRRLIPRVACLNRERRAEAFERLKTFLWAYREAWCMFASGVRDAIFPRGTYLMRVAYGVPCSSTG